VGINMPIFDLVTKLVFVGVFDVKGDLELRRGVPLDRTSRSLQSSTSLRRARRLNPDPGQDRAEVVRAKRDLDPPQLSVLRRGHHHLELQEASAGARDLSAVF